MAALPKKKISKVRGKTRRGHYKVTLPNVVIDKTTGTPRLSHRIATDTGMYNGRVALKTKMSKQLEKKLARASRSEKAAAKKAAKKATSDQRSATSAKKTDTAKKPSAKKTEKKSDDK